MVRKWILGTRNFLRFFVAFARQQHHIASSRPRDGVSDSMGTVWMDINRFALRQAQQNMGNDGF